jgi:hypothetical protein
MRAIEDSDTVARGHAALARRGLRVGPSQLLDAVPWQLDSCTRSTHIAEDSKHGDILCGCLISSLIIHTHVITEVIAQYLKENIVGAPPTFMNVTPAFVALAIRMLHINSRDRSSNDATTRQ